MKNTDLAGNMFDYMATYIQWVHDIYYIDSLIVHMSMIIYWHYGNTVSMQYNLVIMQQKGCVCVCYQVTNDEICKLKRMDIPRQVISFRVSEIEKIHMASCNSVSDT